MDWIGAKHIREPYDTEKKFFWDNQHVAGRADFYSGKVVLNPFSPLTVEQRQSVIQNETARLIMRQKNIVPDFKITPEQKEAFRNYGDERAIRETIAGRIVSGDPSALNITQDQMVFSDRIRKEMEKFMGAQ